MQIPSDIVNDDMTVITAVNPKPSLDLTNSILPIERKKERVRDRESKREQRERVHTNRECNVEEYD